MRKICKNLGIISLTVLLGCLFHYPAASAQSDTSFTTYPYLNYKNNPEPANNTYSNSPEYNPSVYNGSQTENYQYNEPRSLRYSNSYPKSLKQNKPKKAKERSLVKNEPKIPTISSSVTEKEITPAVPATTIPIEKTTNIVSKKPSRSFFSFLRFGKKSDSQEVASAESEEAYKGAEPVERHSDEIQEIISPEKIQINSSPRTQFAAADIQTSDNATDATAKQDEAPSSSADYTLGTGDKLKITVFEEPDLSGEFEVNGQGVVSFPMVGEVRAAGLTLRSFEKELINKLNNGYLKDPKVTAEVQNFRHFYIMGEVKTPGSYPYKDGLTVINAVALAGGYTHRASEGEVELRRSGKKMDLKEDAKVLPGDTIVVQERLF
jgi:protein involved in polysaccharide export with SLBB domain